MSVPVPIEALRQRIAEFGGTAFLITATADGQVHVVSADPRVDGGAVVVAAGRSSRANMAANPDVSLLWPRSPDGAYSLIVDGTAAVGADDADVAITPERAVLHRLVDAAGDGPRCITV